jgi:hypothetical protein
MLIQNQLSTISSRQSHAKKRRTPFVVIRTEVRLDVAVTSARRRISVIARHRFIGMHDEQQGAITRPAG